VLLRYLTVHKFGAVLMENALLIVCVLYESISNRRGPSTAFSWATAFGQGLLFAIVFQMFLHLRDAYDFGLGVKKMTFFMRLSQGVVLASIAIAILYYAVPPLSAASAGVPATLLLRAGAFVIVWHVLLRFYLRRIARRVNVLILGTGRLARALATEIVRRPELGFGVCGFLDDNPALLGVSIVNPRVIGLHSDLKRIISERPVKKIVVELPDRRGRLPIDDLLELKASGVSIEEATTLYERLTGKIPVENLKASWMVFSEGFAISSRVMFQKQVLSLMVSALLSILFLPLIPLIAILIKLDSPGPVFHGQERVGRHGKTFTLWKFRSMRRDAELLTGPVWASAVDNRVTRVGRILRRTRLDEVPQLYNILKGDMSLIGPRPERPHFVQQLSDIIPFYGLRHAVKPGITGWAQTNYRYGNTIEDSIEKLQYDLFYIKNMSFMLDAVVIFDTVKTVLVRKGS
jgi:sugar transferase (PEP-CTERM system associated)